MTHRRSFALMSALLFAASLVFSSSAAALPKCRDICTITCPCETPCIIFGTMEVTCAEWACGPPAGSLSLMTVEEFPILDFMDGAGHGSDVEQAAPSVEEDADEVAAE